MSENMIKMKNSLLINGRLKFFAFLCKTSMVDVTLSAGGQFLQAHRIILAVASTYFENFFENLSHEKSPVIFFKDTTFLQLQQVVKYIYSGDVSIAESQLQGFWNLLQSLGIPIETSMANPIGNPQQHSITSSVIVGNDMFVIDNVTQSERNLVGGGLIEPILSPITENSFQMPRSMNGSSLAGSSSLAHNPTQHNKSILNKQPRQ